MARTRLPDEAARGAILRDQLGKLPLPLGAVNIEELARASQGLTGADLKSVAEDGKLLYAHDAANRKPEVCVETYFIRAISDIRANRVRYKRPGSKVSEEPAIGFPTK